MEKQNYGIWIWEDVGTTQCGTLQVAVAFAYYKKWLLIRNNLKD